MFEELFRNRIANEKKLLEEGFSPTEEGLRKEYPLFDSFTLVVTIRDNKVDHFVRDEEIGERYYPYSLDSTVGECVGAVRSAAGEILEHLAAHAFDAQTFLSPLAEDIGSFCAAEWDEGPEWPWDDLDAYILREKKSTKWYGIVMRCRGKYVGREDEDEHEVMNVRVPRDQAEDYWDFRVYFPAYHMNKKSWITIDLERVDRDELFTRIRIARSIIDEENNKKGRKHSDGKEKRK